jgi:hypothetical protein
MQDPYLGGTKTIMTGVQKPFFRPPTKKWWAALVGAATPIILSGIESGFDTDTEGAMAVTAASALILAYIKANDETPTADGVK